MATDPRHKSRVLLEGPDRAPARAMMKAVGFSDEDLARPQIGVAHSWIGTMPCNWNHRKLAEKVMQGVRAAGGTPIEVNTISITDGITMGTEGMKGSLISREVIADSVELVARSHMFDGIVTISGCDKTIPAMTMVLGRLNIPGLMLYCGSIMFGRCAGTEGPVRQAQPDHPGRVRGSRRLQRRQDLPRGVQGRGGSCLSRRGRLRRPVHRQYHGHRLRDARHVAHGLERHTGHRLAEGRGRLRERQAGHGAGAQGHHPALPRDAPELRERHHRRPRYRRVHQCGAPPARYGQGLRYQALHRRLRSPVEEDAGGRRPQAMGHVHRARDAGSRRHGGGGQAPRRGRADPRQREDRDGPDHRSGDRRRLRAGGPGRDQAAQAGPQADGRHRDPSRQSCARAAA